MSLAITCIAVMAIANFLRFRDALYPPVLHALVWMTVLIGYESMRPEVVALPPVLVLIVVCGVVAFSAGALATSYSAPRRPLRALVADTLPSARVCDAYLAVVSLGILPFMLRARALAESGPTTNLLVNLRIVLQGDPARGIPVGSFGLLQYLVPLSAVTLALTYLAPRERGRGWRVALALLVASTYAIVATGRTYLLIVILVLTTLRIASGRTSAWRAVLTVGVLGGIFFAAGALVLGKAGSGTAGEVGHEFMIYAFGGVAALGRRVQSGAPLEWGVNTFRSVLAVLSALGVPVRVPELVQQYEFIPGPTNVYTFYLPYFVDFGFAGTVIGAFAVGALHGRAYRGASRGDARWTFALAFLTYPLFMQFFEDQYLTLLSSWVQVSLWAAIAFGAAALVRRASRARAFPAADDVPVFAP